MRTALLVSVTTLVTLGACGGSHAAENARAKQRIFAPVGTDQPTPPRLIDVGSFAHSVDVQDAVLAMSETELRDRAGSFRLRAKLHLGFTGPGQTLAIDEERLVEQAKSGDVHLRLLEGDGGGMEILSVNGKVYGRSRYGPFVLRDRQSGLGEQREEVAGALASLYALADRGLKFQELGAAQGCTRFGVALGRARPEVEAPRFTGRLDGDTLRRFQFDYARRLVESSGEICVNPSGFVLHAHLSLHWSAGGDAGAGEVRAQLDQSLSDLGGAVHLATPETFEPEPHRPRGPFATLDRFGFVQHPDGG